MTFHDWLYSIYPPDSVINGRYKPLHIFTMLLVVTVIVALSLVFRKRTEKQRLILISAISALILLFEIVRRVINITKYEPDTANAILTILLPRPWCAISCWFMIFAPIVRKRFFYNFTASNGIVCALVFFAYPAVGFNHSVILFENLYSIATHSLLLTGAVLYITLRFTSFRYYSGSIFTSALRELLLLASVIAYAFIEIYVLKIEPDPLYFLKGNDVQDFLGCSYPVYLIIYCGFLALYFNAFYVVEGFIAKRRAKQGADL